MIVAFPLPSPRTPSDRENNNQYENSGNEWNNKPDKSEEEEIVPAKLVSD
jgi:hypothetical protein